MSHPPIIPGYELLRLIGRGGMGMVYLANDEQNGREVALKVMQKELAKDDPKFVERFAREAEITASLRHPNVITVYDSGQHDGSLYMAMQFYPAGALDQRLRMSPMGHTEVVRIVDGLAAGLECAHAAGLVHRDIKPANILLDVDGTPVLTDFGVVKITESETELTGTNIVGSPSYMSPEQLLGEKVDARADLYSVGVVLFQMLEGHKPFVSDQAYAVGLMHLNDDPPPLSEKNARFQGVVSRLLEKRPGDRYPSAASLRTAINELPPAAALPTTRPRRAIPSDPEGVSVNMTPNNGPRGAGGHKSFWLEEKQESKASKRRSKRGGSGSFWSGRFFRLVLIVAIGAVGFSFALPGFRFDAIDLELKALFSSALDRYEIGERLESRGQIERARFWYKLAGSGGHAGAYYRLGTSLRFEDEAEAIAALDGEMALGRRSNYYSPAASMLGNVLCNRRAVENCDRAIRILESAVDNSGDRGIMLQLAQLHHHREPPDYGSALHWYQEAIAGLRNAQASNSTHEDAMLGIAEIHSEGAGVAQDALAAAQWTARAASHPKARQSTIELAIKRCSETESRPSECSVLAP